MRRWDTDERGRGIASAEAFAPAAERLLGAMREADWVAEEPEHHLLPHARRLCELEGWRLASTNVDEGVLLLEVALPAGADRRALRVAGYSIIGTFAEESTHIVQHGSSDACTLDVVTGMPTGSGEFGSHGHTIRVSLSVDSD